MRGRAKFTLSVIVVALAGFAAALAAPSLLSPQRVKQPGLVRSSVLAAKIPVGSNALSLEESLKREKELRLILESQQEGFIEEIFRLKQQLKSSEVGREQSEGIEQEEMRGDLPADSGLREKQLQAENAELKARLSTAQSQVGAQYDSSSQISLLQAKTSELSAELTQCQERTAEGERLLRDLGDRQKEFHLITKQAAARERALQACSTELESSKNRLLEMEELKRDLVSAKTELRLQETEQALLGGAPAAGSEVKSPQLQASITGRSPSRPSNRGTPPRATAVPAVPDVQKGSIRVNSESEQSQLPNKEVLVVEVTRTKINLRSGPGREHSPVIQVPKGSRLVVEDRVGDWYRVITPTGARAYVKTDVVRVLSGGSSAQLYGEAAPEASSREAPGKPPVRVSKDDAALVPFGSVKLGGRSSGSRDPEQAAYERLKTMLQSSGAGARENEVRQ